MIRYILIDDEPKILERVKAKIDTISKEYQLQHIKSYSSSVKAFEEINIDDYDLLIIDFEMPVYNGLELAEKIATNKKIIFLTSTTNNEKKIINSLDISGYLSKPFELDEFQKILKNKIYKKIKNDPTSNSNKPITLHIGKNRDVIFKPDQAFYISTSKNINGELPDKNCVHIYGKNDKIIAKNVRKSINELSKDLADYNFKRTNQSTIINMSHLKERDNTNISLFQCNETFEVSAKEKTSLVEKIRKKLGI